VAANLAATTSSFLYLNFNNVSADLSVSVDCLLRTARFTGLCIVGRRR
jgi:hypothetical protein